jgi:hypothetical protein
MPLFAVRYWLSAKNTLREKYGNSVCWCLNNIAHSRYLLWLIALWKKRLKLCIYCGGHTEAVVVFAQQDISSRAAIMINEVFIFCSYGRVL